MMHVAWVVVIGFATITHAVATPNAKSVQPADVIKTGTYGSLQRTAASVDDVLDVYRLALFELLPALKNLEVQGAQPDALPTSPLPAVVHEVFARHAAALPHRFNEAALPALVRAYHVEMLQALDDLAQATLLQDIVVPAANLLSSLQALLGQAEAIVAVFAHKRPVRLEQVSPDSTLDAIGDALDQLALAEANMGAVRTHRGSQGEQLQAFLRLEMALSHLLDLIASAQESGLHLGFELPYATVGMSSHITSVRQQVLQLQQMIERMQEPPHVAVRDVRGYFYQQPAHNAQVQLFWTPPHHGHPAPRLLRLYRRDNIDGTREAMRLQWVCDGQTPEVIEARLAALLNNPSEQLPRHVIDMAPGRSGYQDNLLAMPLAPPLYRLVEVTAFGIESRADEIAAVPITMTLAPPKLVAATLAAPKLGGPTFYRDIDAVTVTWQASLSDAVVYRVNPQPAASVAVLRYQVFRLHNNTSQLIAQVPAGINKFVDHPSTQMLREGLRYAVAAIDQQGQTAQVVGTCGQSALVQSDLQALLAQARAGAMYLPQPTAFERAHTALLTRDVKALGQRRAEFLAREKTAQQQALQAFWQQTPSLTRVQWYRQWLSLVSVTQRTQIIPNSAVMPKALWAKIDLLASQDPWPLQEVDRYWALLDPASRQDMLQRFGAQLGPGLSTSLQKRLLQWVAPAQRFAWWFARDAQEQVLLQQQWQQLPPLQQQAQLDAWWATLDPELQQAAFWPEWDDLPAVDREQWLTAGYQPLWPDALWPTFLAWAEWEELPLANKVTLIAHEVGVWKHWLAKIRFWCRPLDVWLGFKLGSALLLLLISSLSGFLLNYVLRQPQGEDPPEW